VTFYDDDILFSFQDLSVFFGEQILCIGVLEVSYLCYMKGFCGVFPALRISSTVGFDSHPVAVLMPTSRVTIAQLFYSCTVHRLIYSDSFNPVIASVAETKLEPQGAETFRRSRNWSRVF
jgi:hypothetical protein